MSMTLQISYHVGNDELSESSETILQGHGFHFVSDPSDIRDGIDRWELNGDYDPSTVNYNELARLAKFENAPLRIEFIS